MHDTLYMYSLQASTYMSQLLELEGWLRVHMVEVSPCPIQFRMQLYLADTKLTQIY